MTKVDKVNKVDKFNEVGKGKVDKVLINKVDKLELDNGNEVDAEKWHQVLCVRGIGNLVFLLHSTMFYEAVNN